MNNKHNQSKKNKTLSTYIALFLGLFGIHYLYINKHKKIAILHTSASLLFMLGVVLFQYSQTSILVWILLWIGVINWCSVWLTSIYYGLMQEEKWIAYIKTNKNYTTENEIDKKFAKTNGLTVLCIIIDLMLGMGSLMAFLSFTIQSYYS